MAIPTGPRPQRRSRRKSPDVEAVKEGGATLQSPVLEQQKKSSPTRGAGRPGRQALHPPGAHGRQRPRILTERVSAPARDFCYVAERRPQNFLSWSRLCLSTNQSLRGNLELGQSESWAQILPIKTALGFPPQQENSAHRLQAPLLLRHPGLRTNQ